MSFRYRVQTIALVILLGFAGLATLVGLAVEPPASSGDQPLDDRAFEKLAPLDRELLDQLVGHAPPAWSGEITWVGGDALDWSGLRGRVVVIQSWTSKTAAGRAIPARASKALADFTPDDVQLIALHTPDGADTAPTFLERRPAAMPVAIDASGAFCDALGVFRKPVNIVIDRQGAVRYAGVKLRTLPDAVGRLVDEPFDAQAAPPSPRPVKRKPTASFPAIRGSVGSARDVRGRAAPDFRVQQWLTAEPDASGKVTIVEFWATWCGPCRKSIPHMNELAAEFSDDLVIVGVSKEDTGKIQNFMRSTPMRYYVASDPAGRMSNAVGVRGIPHAIVMSSDWVVRWQGHPASLNARTLRQIIDADGGDGPDMRRYRWTSG
ncbi:MAG: redoxin domain-containing protein [Planctomycetota bacterium]|jgi:thiol-disulfide isomerase/thioredoxin